MKKTFKLCAALLALCVSAAGITASAEKIEFTDVKETDYFYPAVEWGVEAGITKGVGDNLFAPDGEVTRAQVVTFLWNMAENPTPTSDETFDDVAPGSWYETAVKWAVENKITAGTGDGMFSPDVVCSRAMCISLLYRMKGSPLDGIDTESDAELSFDMTEEEFGKQIMAEFVKGLREEGAFADVAEGEYYELPVIWASLSGVITEDNTEVSDAGIVFKPDDACVRKEMISFLYQTKLADDMANAPVLLGGDPVMIPIPKEYYDEELLSIEYYGVSDGDEEEYDGIGEDVVIVSERASKDAAEAMDEDTDGIGELFRIVRVSEDRLHELLCGDMSGIETLGKDEDGWYYLMCFPTDVRFFRESNEKMNEDIEIWSELNGWARGELRNEILSYNDGLTEVVYSNTMLDMYLARILYSKDIKYTISTTEFGPLDPGKVDPTEYAEFLLGGTFAVMEDIDEAPDGEYVVLNFPEEGVRYDFFTANKNLVREVRDDYTVFYKRGFSDPVNNTEVMQKWYDALAKQAGKK